MEGQRGRKGQKVSLVPLERPEPPADLDADHATIWRTTVNRLPPDWFPAETHQILKEYCRHAVSSDRLAARIAVLEAECGDAKELHELLKMRRGEVTNMATLATRMRISQQSTYDATKTKGKGKGSAAAGGDPWDG